jgi:MoxR-like ATPase
VWTPPIVLQIRATCAWLRELVRQVPVARQVQDFAIRVLEGTHPPTDAASKCPPLTRKFVRYGASPRGAQSCLLGAKIRALLDGRFAVSCDDVRAVAKPTLRHRLILNFEGEAEGIDPDTIIDSILAETPEQA